MSIGRVIARCYVVRQQGFAGIPRWFAGMDSWFEAGPTPQSALWAWGAKGACEMDLKEARRVAKLCGGKVYRRGKRAAVKGVGR